MKQKESFEYSSVGGRHIPNRSIGELAIMHQLTG